MSMPHEFWDGYLVHPQIVSPDYWQKIHSPNSLDCRSNHGHLHTGQLSRHFFLTSDQHEGEYLGPKLHPGGGFLDHDFL